MRTFIVNIDTLQGVASETIVSWKGANLTALQMSKDQKSPFIKVETEIEGEILSWKLENGGYIPEKVLPAFWITPDMLLQKCIYDNVPSDMIFCFKFISKEVKKKQDWYEFYASLGATKCPYYVQNGFTYYFMYELDATEYGFSLDVSGNVVIPFLDPGFEFTQLTTNLAIDSDGYIKKS